MANAIRKGAVGDSTYYYRNGEQIVRQRRNNSNYGDTASRTQSQMQNRVRWANLVNCYKACRDWMPRAFESKKSNQTDYNRFMSVNKNTSATALTKDQALNGCAVMEKFIVSQGSITPIQVTDATSATSVTRRTDIAVTISLSASTTIAQLAENIIANNQDFKANDNLAFVLFRQSVDDRDYPYLVSEYHEVTLDLTNTEALSTKGIYPYLGVEGGFLGVLDTAIDAVNYGSFVFIHTRKNGGSLQVSTQEVKNVDRTFVGIYSSRAAINAAIDSYGVDAEVPLDPSFNSAVVTSVLANGSVIVDGSTIEDSFGLLINGERLNPSVVKLYKDGVYYPALNNSDTSQAYLIDSDGQYILYVNGSRYVTFNVTGNTIPSSLVGTAVVVMTNVPDITGGDNVEREEFASLPATFAKRLAEEHPYYRLVIPCTQTLNIANFNVTNGSIVNSSQYSENEFRIMLTAPINASQPLYVEFGGKVIAVMNYTAY